MVCDWCGVDFDVVVDWSRADINVVGKGGWANLNNGRW